MLELPRTILHVDMDAFFASVEQRDFPQTRGKPLLVGGTSGRGVVTAASYEARVFGCHSAMPMSMALRLCPHAIVHKGRYDAYRDASDRVFDVFERYTPQVQSLSIDEAFLDCTNSIRLHGDGVMIAEKIRSAIKAEINLTASVGVAHNKFLAKLASDMNKPDGLTVITPQTMDAILPPLAIGKIWGIGPKTAEKLNRRGIHTVADLRKQSPLWLERTLGEWGSKIRQLSYGLDDRPVHSDRSAKSIGHEQTFSRDVLDPDVLRDVLLDHVETVGQRLRRAKHFAASVTVKIRYNDFKTLTRRSTLPQPVDTTRELYAVARSLFDAWASERFGPVRLLGFAVSTLQREAQLDLFAPADSSKRRTIDSVVDTIKAKFGKESIGRGRGKEKRPREPNENREHIARDHE